MKVFELGARAFQVSVVVKEMQAAEKLLRLVADEHHDLLGTEKTMPAKEPDDVVVALGQLQRSGIGSATEAG